jgi:hypothetical protein
MGAGDVRGDDAGHGRERHTVSAVVWVMAAIALWHFTILLPDRFYGGIIGAFLAALAGAVLIGYVGSGLSIPTDNPPGIFHVVVAIPGACLGLAVSYVAGARSEAARD